MGWANSAGCWGHSGNGRKSGHDSLATMGGCKDTEGHIFTIGSENKGKVRDMIQTSTNQITKDMITTYIETKYGDDTVQERTGKEWAALQEPTYSQAILSRHAESLKKTKDCGNINLNSLWLESTTFNTKIVLVPRDCKLMIKKVGSSIRSCVVESSCMMKSKWSWWRTRRWCTAQQCMAKPS